MSTSYRQRMLDIAASLKTQGVNPMTSAPPLYRLAWLCGIRVRPPFYQSFLSVAFSMGAY